MKRGVNLSLMIGTSHQSARRQENRQMAHAAAYEQKDVRELQRLAQEAPLQKRRARKRPPSRAAMLALIDILSRWSATGLALIAGLSIYLAVTVGRAYPARAATWALLMLAALWICRRLRNQFRSGGPIAARPFHWRASYTSCISVLGVIFASAPILLIPADAPGVLFLQVAAIALLGAFSAAMIHSAHLAAAAAFAAPAAILPCLSALRAGDMAMLIALAAISAMGFAVTYGLNRTIAADAARRNPRTTFLRREIENAGVAVNAPATAPSAAGVL